METKLECIELEILESLEVFDYDSRTRIIASYIKNRRVGHIKYMQVLGLICQRPYVCGSVARIISS